MTEKDRVRNFAAVPTPAWLVKDQVDAIDAFFANDGLEAYVSRVWLEPACGNAPYLAEVLKRKLARISAETNDLSSWTKLAALAFQSVRGFEINLSFLYAGRRKLLGLCREAYGDKFGCDPQDHDDEWIKEIISRNLFKMDGLGHEDWKTGFPCVLLKRPIDAIIGNPPYQKMDGGFGASAAPVYHAFVERAKALDPSYLSMIIPARWFSCGKNLSGFRVSMLSDKSISQIHDYRNARAVFPDVEIKGGVCWFLREMDHFGECLFCSHEDRTVYAMNRDLDEFDILIRENRAASILRKVLAAGERSFKSVASSRNPFGLPTNFQPKRPGLIRVYGKGRVFDMAEADIPKGRDLVWLWKVFVPYAFGKGAYDEPKPFAAGPGCVCTDTYLFIGPFSEKRFCENAVSYMKTRFFRFLLGLRKITQHAPRDACSFIPMCDFSKSWSDAELFAMYGLDNSEIAFINRLF